MNDIWKTLNSKLCTAANLPELVGGIKNKDNQFFQKYFNKETVSTKSKKIIASSSETFFIKSSLPRIAHFEKIFSPFNEAEKIRILQCLNVFEKKMSQDAIDTVISIFKSLKHATSPYIFHLFTESSALKSKDSPTLFLSVMQKLIELSNDIPNLLTHLKKYQESKMSLQELSKELDDRKEQIEREKYPEKPLEQVYKDFSTAVPPHISYPLAKAQLDRCFEQYKQLQKIELTIKQVGLKEWQTIIQEINKRCETKPIQNEDLLKLLAIGRQAICSKFKIYPYNTQIITILGLLSYGSSFKGRIAQVKTGEGKSTISTLLAFVEACQGKTVDIVSPSRYLAKRDAEKYASFFQDFNISTSHICLDDPTIENFKGQIIYGTNYDFEFAYMRDMQNDSPKRVIKRNNTLVSRPFQVVIVDEVDSLFIDSALNSARIAIPSQSTTAWVYHPILEFVKNNLALILLDLFEIKQLRDHLNKVENGFHKKEMEEIDDEQLKIWFGSALQALISLKEGIDYVIKDQESESILESKVQKEIVIVDWKNTGRLNEKSRWNGGLHEFIEAKHGLQIREESFTSASISHPVYFSLYDRILGLTGTLGTDIERKELQVVYSVDTFDVPPHKPNLRQIHDPIICENEKAQFEKALETVKTMHELKRPSLLLFDTIQKTESFSEFMSKKGLTYQINNEMQNEIEDFIIARAGQPKMITIATNTAGRGTDILLDPISLQNGGLHVVFMFFPENDRVELQGFGRSGRQGQPGTGHFILSSKKTIEQLYSEREEKIKQISDMRINQIKHEKSCHGYLLHFWKAFNDFQKLPFNRFSIDKVEKWINENRYKLTQSNKQGLENLEAFIRSFKDPHKSILIDEEIFCKTARQSIIHIALQNWSQLFYSKLSRHKSLQDIDNLYNSTKSDWELIFKF